jgi:hypothetical protein
LIAFRRLDRVVPVPCVEIDDRRTLVEVLVLVRLIDDRRLRRSE